MDDLTAGAPLLVLDDPSSIPAVRRRLAAGTWSVREGFALPDEPWDVSGLRLVCAGDVADEASAHDALLAAARGAGLIVWGATEAVLDDLARVGPVERVQLAGVVDTGPLDEDQWRLLHLIAAGRSTPEAAAELYLSQRTAERKLAAARKALGARTTAEAVLRVTARAAEPDGP